MAGLYSQEAPYQPTRDKILAVTRPYVPKSLWSALDEIVTENASVEDILQRATGQELISEYDQTPFEKVLRKAYQKKK